MRFGMPIPGDPANALRIAEAKTEPPRSFPATQRRKSLRHANISNCRDAELINRVTPASRARANFVKPNVAEVADKRGTAFVEAS